MIAGGYNHEKPLVERRLIPEWVEKSSGLVVHKPSPKVKEGCYRLIQDFSTQNTVVIASGWSIQSGGKMPENIIMKGDAWLRKQKAEEPRIVLALSSPNAHELQLRSRLNQ